PGCGVLHSGHRLCRRPPEQSQHASQPAADPLKQPRIVFKQAESLSMRAFICCSNTELNFRLGRAPAKVEKDPCVLAPQSRQWLNQTLCEQSVTVAQLKR
ncbi:hypothetical protein, partial [Metallibacterium sp.]